MIKWNKIGGRILIKFSNKNFRGPRIKPSFHFPETGVSWRVGEPKQVGEPKPSSTQKLKNYLFNNSQQSTIRIKYQTHLCYVDNWIWLQNRKKILSLNNYRE